MKRTIISIIGVVVLLTMFLGTATPVAASTDINSVTLTYDGNTVPPGTLTVPPGAEITVEITVTTSDGFMDSPNWKSTSWRIGEWSMSNPFTCVDVPDPNITSEGTNTRSFTITAPDAPGIYNAYFRAYGGNNCHGGYDSTTLSSAVTVQSGPSYTLTANVSGSGTVTKIPDQSTYTPGTVVTLQANPDGGQYFTGWSDDLSSTATPTNITMDGNKTVTANFVSETPSCSTAYSQTPYSITQEISSPNYEWQNLVLSSGMPDSSGIWDPEDDWAYVYFTSAGNSRIIYLQDFEFSIPSGATITGIRVEYERHADGSVTDSQIQLMQNGSPVGTPKYGDSWAPAGQGNYVDEVAYFGGPCDLWGTTWTRDDINNSGFGVAVAAQGASGATAYIDDLDITVFYDCDCPGPSCRLNVTTNPANGAYIYIYNTDNSTWISNGDYQDSFNDYIPCGFCYDVWVTKSGWTFLVNTLTGQASGWSGIDTTTASGCTVEGQYNIHFVGTECPPPIPTAPDVTLCEDYDQDDLEAAVAAAGGGCECGTHSCSVEDINDNGNDTYTVTCTNECDTTTATGNILYPQCGECEKCEDGACVDDPSKDPTADFSASPTSGCSPLNVQFTDTSNNPYGTLSWDWDFDDGTHSSQQNPNHDFTIPRTYNVELTVSNACGSDTKLMDIVVTATPTVTTPDVYLCDPYTPTELETAVLATGGCSVGTPSVVDNGDDTYTLTCTNGNCTASDDGNINTTETPVVTAPDVSLCDPYTPTELETAVLATGGCSVGTPSVVDNGDDTYTLTCTNGNCTASDDGNINTTETPVVTAPPVTLCDGYTQTDLEDEVLATGGCSVGTPCVADNGDGTYTLTCTNGQCSASDDGDITVVSNPSCDITAPSQVCEGDTVNASVPDAGGGATYTWTLTGDYSALSGDDTNAISFTAGSAGTINIKVSVENANGCTCSNDTGVDVTVLECGCPDCYEAVSDSYLSDTGTGIEGGGNAVLAYDPAGWDSSLDYPFPTAAEWVWTTVQVSEPINGEVATFVETVTIPADAIDIMTTVHVTCDNGYELYLDDTTSPYIGRAQLEDGWGPGNLTESYCHTTGWQSVETYNPTLTPGTHTFIFKCANEYMGPADNQSDGTVDRNPAGLIYEIVINYCIPNSPTAEITPDPAETCEGTALQLNGNPSGGTPPYTHSWTGDTTYLSATNVVDPTLTDSAPAGTYNLTYTVTDSEDCTGSDDITVTVHPTPDCSFTFDTDMADKAICALSTGHYACVFDDPDIKNWSWALNGDFDPGSVYTSPSGNCLYFDAGAYNNGFINISVDITNIYDCTCTNSAQITVYPTPDCTITIDTDSQDGVCSGSTGHFASVPSDPGYPIYTWIVTGDYTNLGGLGTNQITFDAADVTTLGNIHIEVTVEDAQTHCSCTNSTDIPVYPNPDCTLILDGDPNADAVCEESTGHSICLADTTGVTDIGWNYAGDITNVSFATDKSCLYFDVTTYSYGYIDIYVEVEDANGCICGNLVSITVNENPVAAAANNGPVCEGTTLTLTGGPDSMTSYSWTGPDGFTSDEQSPTVSTSATLAMAGTYTLTVTNANGCQDTATTDVTVNPTPPCDIATDSIVIAGSTHNAAGPAGMDDYAWTVTDGTLDSGQGTQTISYTAGNGPTVYIELTVTANRCTSTCSTTVIVETPGPPPGGPPGPDKCYMIIDMLGERTLVEMECCENCTVEEAEAYDENLVHLLELEDDTLVICGDCDGCNCYPKIIVMSFSDEVIDPPEGMTLVGPLYDFTGYKDIRQEMACHLVTSFDPMATVLLNYNPNLLPPGASEPVIGFYSHAEGRWVLLPPDTGRVAEIGTASGVAGYFASPFAVLASAPPVETPEPPPATPAPAHFVASGLSIAPAEVNTGETVTISLNVANDGEESGTYTAELKINGSTIDSKVVTLDGGQSQAVSFAVSASEAGAYDASVAGLNGSFTVVKSSTWWIYLIIAAVVIIAGLLALRFRRGKAKS
jgi:PKD repeat protein